MPRPSIVEQNYFEFKLALQRAADAGSRIDKSDKERWKSWVRAHRVQEAAFLSLASRKFDGGQAVIIDEAGPWGGYYIFTTVEEVCLKWSSD